MDDTNAYTFESLRLYCSQVFVMHSHQCCISENGGNNSVLLPSPTSKKLSYEIVLNYLNTNQVVEVVTPKVSKVTCDTFNLDKVEYTLPIISQLPAQTRVTYKSLHKINSEKYAIDIYECGNDIVADIHAPYISGNDPFDLEDLKSSFDKYQVGTIAFNGYVKHEIFSILSEVDKAMFECVNFSYLYQYDLTGLKEITLDFYDKEPYVFNLSQLSKGIDITVKSENDSKGLIGLIVKHWSTFGTFTLNSINKKVFRITDNNGPKHIEIFTNNGRNFAYTILKLVEMCDTFSINISSAEVTLLNQLQEFVYKLTEISFNASGMKFTHVLKVSIIDRPAVKRAIQVKQP